LNLDGTAICRDFDDADGEREVAYGRSETSNSRSAVALHCDMNALAYMNVRSRGACHLQQGRVP
jgi:hypothetical protein